MQKTRQQILDVLGELENSTIEELVVSLRKKRGDTITAVTVRHHLKQLLTQGLIAEIQSRPRNGPGRPQHIYTLTEKAKDYYPNNYHSLAVGLLAELSDQLPASTVNVILEGVASRMYSEAGNFSAPITERLDQVVAYLNQHGYNARWAIHDEGYILHTANCPYHHVTRTNQALCEMDFQLVASLIGVVPRLVARKSQGDTTCSYLVPYKETNR
jgi:predicted ArsR family transcriptional regulator